MGWSFHNNKPIYLQIVEKLERDILSGKLPPGERIPSVRELALDASVNPNTMQRAMQELEARGLAVVQRTSGRIVTTDEKIINETRKRIACENIRFFIEEMKQLGFSGEETQALIKEEWKS